MKTFISRLALALFALGWVSLAIPVPAAHATITVTNAISMPNLTRWKVVKLQDSRDEAEPFFLVAIEVLSPGGVVYGPASGAGRGVGAWYLTITDNAGTCQGLRAKASPVGYFDKLEIYYPGTTGALSALMEAVDGAASTRSAKWKAAETSLLATGVVAAKLGGTQN